MRVGDLAAGEGEEEEEGCAEEFGEEVDEGLVDSFCYEAFEEGEAFAERGLGVL